MASLKNVLIIGASGALGIPTLEEFLNPQYRVSVLSRRESTATFPDGVKVFKADYNDPDAIKAAMEGQDVVISIVGGHAAEDQRLLIDAALASGVKRFFPSEYGPYTRDPKMAKINPYTNPYKSAIVDYLQSKETEMSWTSLVTGGFFDWAMDNGFFGFDFGTKTAGLIDDGITTFCFYYFSNNCQLSERRLNMQMRRKINTSSVRNKDIPVIPFRDYPHRRYVGHVMVRLRTSPRRHHDIFIASFHHTQRDILNEIEKLDDQKWAIQHLSSDNVIANGEKRVKEGDFAGIMDLTRGAAMGKPGLVDLRSHGLWNEKLGLPKEHMADVLTRYI
ncbi:isoflavone reductase [Colletotrichum truncatum]|uniref:Isoflavone reductase n=1 Tax=Colletotrichum truncatum TaxID=5467 RepID=A0ACC3ZKU0_COLTU